MAYHSQQKEEKDSGSRRQSGEQESENEYRRNSALNKSYMDIIRKTFDGQGYAEQSK